MREKMGENQAEVKQYVVKKSQTPRMFALSAATFDSHSEALRRESSPSQEASTNHHLVRGGLVDHITRHVCVGGGGGSGGSGSGSGGGGGGGGRRRVGRGGDGVVVLLGLGPT